ncbi:hypothetical protein MT997_15100 [Paenibacillus sp. OVF10]|nr:hypothetical protein MT997_15100 [Paenibacillus sp. OVF10]
MWLTLFMLLVLAGLPPADAPGFSREAADALSAALESTDEIPDPVGADQQARTASIPQVMCSPLRHLVEATMARLLSQLPGPGLAQK